MKELDINVLNNSAAVDFSEVAISGLTTAYKVPYSSLAANENQAQGYTLESAVEIYNEQFDVGKNVYLQVGVDAVVLIANPLINFAGEIFYKFKEWRIYTKDSAEYMTYNPGVTNSLSDEDRTGTILRFKSTVADHYLILPIYEKLYSISIGMETITGTPNIGGSINITSSSQSTSIDEDDHTQDVFALQYTQDGYEVKSTDLFMFFTGNYIGDYPIFAKVGVAEDFKTNSKAISIIPTKVHNNIYTVNIYQGTQRIGGIYNVFKSEIISKGWPSLVKVEKVGLTYSIYNTNVQSLIGEYIDYNANSFKKVSTTLSGKVSVGGDRVTVKLDGYYFVPDSYVEDEEIVNLMHYRGEVAKENKSFKFIRKATTSDYVVFNDKLYCFNERALNFGADLSKVITDKNTIAVIKRHAINYTYKNKDAFYNDTYYNNNNNLTSGEYYLAEDGVTVNTSIEYKTTYYNRDDTIEITAIPNAGYRLEGWYLAEYDKDYGWVVADKTITEQFETNYSDEIVKTEFEKDNSAAKTFNIALRGINPDNSRYTRTYTVSNQYYDEFTLRFANNGKIVPASIKSEYCAIFANVGVSHESPKFVRLYMKEGDRTSLYYDEDFRFEVKASDFSVSISTTTIDKLWEDYYIGYTCAGHSLCIQIRSCYNRNGIADILHRVDGARSPSR